MPLANCENAGRRPRVALVDYGSGNLRSVEKALARSGADVVHCVDAAPLGSCEAVVLPGVGSFGDCARSLRARQLTEPLREWLASGRPYLGICLGYQILFERSEESDDEYGLGHWRGEVVRFTATPGLKIPHMGWNNLKWGASDSMFAGIEEPAYVFFVHSYYPVPVDLAIITATSTHGVEFAAAARSGRVHGVQFHPEKSQSTGLRMLENFVRDLRGDI